MIDQTPDLFAAPVLPAPSEQAKRDAVLTGLEAQRRRFLEDLRRAMRLLLLERREAVARTGSWRTEAGTLERDVWVSADDVRRVFESWNPPAAINRNFLGAVFRGGWAALEHRRVLSTTPGSHANELKCWTLDRG